MNLKNKMLLGMDKLIVEAEKAGGIPGSIELDQNEAMTFIIEVSNVDLAMKRTVTGKHKDDNNFDVRFLLKEEKTKPEAIELVKRWHRGEFKLYYKNVELLLVPTKKNPLPPALTIERIIRENSVGICKKCGSSLHRAWFFLPPDGCINHECSEYYANY